MEPARFDEMRKGCWDIHARIADMDLAGIWASLCFPSLIAGFAGAAFARSHDPELGLACVRAWNDWHHEVWAGSYPERIIPLQLAWLRDPEVAAADVRRNAERGFKAVTFPESMNNLDLPSVHTEHWDPFLRACEETETVVCLHTGSGSISPPRSPESPLEQSTTLFPVHGMLAAADWLWARIPLRFPRLNVALSEGGIGWVPMLLDRLDYVMAHSGIGGGRACGTATSRRRRRCSATSGSAPSTTPPPCGSATGSASTTSWWRATTPTPTPRGPTPRRCWPTGSPACPRADVAELTHENAARLFRHPLPPTGFVEGSRVSTLIWSGRLCEAGPRVPGRSRHRIFGGAAVVPSRIATEVVQRSTRRSRLGSDAARRRVDVRPLRRARSRRAGDP